MAKAAQSEELKAAFEKHLTETEGQIERLEQVFAVIEQKPQGKMQSPSLRKPSKRKRPPMRL
jgi:ferritin-like metal-binding protein YciE